LAAALLWLGFAVACSDPPAPTAATDASAAVDAAPELGFGSGVDALSDGAPPATDVAPDTANSCEFALSPDPGQPGATCAGAQDCDSGFCLETADGKRCSTACIQCCPDGWKCADIGTGDTVFACVPRTPNLCRPCQADTECAAKGDDQALCVDQGTSGRFCGATCASDAECPPTYACQTAQGTQGSGKQCVRKGGECPCTPKATAQGATTTCNVTNVAGTCKGARKCGPDGLTACDAAIPSAESCNGQDDDCDGATDEQGAAGCKVYWQDADGDGVGGGKTAADGKKQCLCAPLDLFTAPVVGDCDDKDKAVLPGASEVCNDVDDNCAAGIDEGCDDDKDGFCDKAMAVVGAPKTCAKGGEKDCDDQKANVFPGQKETCGNLLDDNCNGGTDNEEGALGCVSYYLDADKDGAGSALAKCLCAPEGEFTAKQSGDCSDNDPEASPGKPEVCGNAKDDNCNGQQDEPDAGGCTPFYLDQDGDGFGTGKPQCLCAPNQNYTVKKAGDCDDKSAKINPAMTEVCNGLDDDCGGDVDEANALNCLKWYADADKDGFGNDGSFQCLCKPQGAFTAQAGGDCDDQKAKANPKASEACDGYDNDCDAAVDEVGADGCAAWWVDSDGDGFGDTGKTACLCAKTAPYNVQKGGDCNDAQKAAYPGAVETCNGLDDNCQSGVDEENAQGCGLFLLDDDGDGFGQSGKFKCLCKSTKPYSAQKGEDCNDQNPAIKPGAIELCDAADNNCDGTVDNPGAVGCTAFFPDNDGDGFGGIVASQCLCSPKAPYQATSSGDCNDLDKSIYPKAPESCDNKDTDCDGIVDPINAAGCKTFYQDADKDAWGVTSAAQCACNASGNFTAAQAGDCNDQNPNVKPGAQEVCNGVDDNCNGAIDTDAVGAATWYADADGDGYGTQSSMLLCSPSGVFKAKQAGDCNDQNAGIHPAAADVCNGVDDNCNGGVDDGPAATLCPNIPNGAPSCQAGKCVPLCPSKQFNIDGQYNNGCECSADGLYGGASGSCGGALDLGQLADNGSSVQKSGNIMPGEAGDWYRFHAIDTADGNGGCDKFSPRATLVGNPDGQFAIDFYRGECGSANQLCAGGGDSGWTTNFYGSQPSGPQAGKGGFAGDVVKSPNPEKAGECKCAGGSGLPGMNVCSDNSAHFFVRVYRVANAPGTCSYYTLQMSNGL